MKDKKSPEVNGPKVPMQMKPKPAPRMPGKMSPDAKKAALKNYMYGMKKGNK